MQNFQLVSTHAVEFQNGVEPYADFLRRILGEILTNFRDSHENLSPTHFNLSQKDFEVMKSIDWSLSIAWMPDISTLFGAAPIENTSGVSFLGIPIVIKEDAALLSSKARPPLFFGDSRR